MTPDSETDFGIRARLGRVLSTTAFKLSALYLVIFVVFAIFVLGYLAWNTRRLLDAQITETIETEIKALADQYQQGGVRRLITTMERRGRQSGSFLYLLVDQRGDSITGNALLRVPALEQNVGWSEARYTWPDEGDEVDRLAKLRVFALPSGLRLIVGRDLEERRRLGEVIRRARGWSLLMVILLGGFGIWFVTKRVLSRVDGIAKSSSAIMAGDMSERLPVANSNDEFDRLSLHLNRMLDRMAELMAGLRGLSDNVAHDLRTPLTRLRNGAEQALGAASTLEDAKAALEKAIQESDSLIRVFDALLMIARAESGSMATSPRALPLDELVSGVVDLYEPLAEQAGYRIRTELKPGLQVEASRELVGQALSNLLDNALKYGAPLLAEGSIAPAEIVVSTDTEAGNIRIIVADRGGGIPQADRERVLERFIRLDPSRAKPGFGLGLSLVNAIAKLHGGRFLLEDNAPGLRAVLVLPAATVKNSADG